MKKLNFYPYAIFIVLTFVLGCNEFIDKYESTWEYKYEQLVGKSLEAEKPRNNIFLNFELGMTPEAFKFHERELLKKQVIAPVNYEPSTKFSAKISGSSQYRFDMNLKSGVYEVHYKPIFVDGKLVELNVEILPKILGSNLTKLYREVIQVYRNKYGDDFLEKKQVFGSNNFFWFESNKQVKLSENVMAIHVKYSDLNWLDLRKESSDNALLEQDSSNVNEVEKYL